ncbi:hypothetical protein SPB21_30315 [Leptothoe sp. ISB3NOV94-8A]
MINDEQARTLLSECELWLGTNLDSLRKKLRNDHENTKPMLWELIVLHATASSIVSRYNKEISKEQSIAALIQHEPTDAAPDIFLQPHDCQPFYIEIAHIQPRNQQEEEEVKHFHRWIKQELSRKGILYTNSLGIRLIPADDRKDVQVPPQNRWKKQLKTNSWTAFVTELLSQKLPSTWHVEEANVIVEARISSSSSFPAQNIPERATDNPIYKTIERKAGRQAKRTWEGKYGSKEPLVLVIGASESLHQITGHDALSSRQLQKAVYSALADTDKWDWTTILNLTDNRSWSWAMHRQRVSGSGFISAVVIVTVSNEYSRLGYGWQKKAKHLIIKNPHPTVSITAEQEQFLEKINFNQIKYGHGREQWEQLPKNQINPTPSLNRYLIESEGFSACFGEDSAFYIEIPCQLFARFLVGDITADEVWCNYRLSINSDKSSTRSLEETIGSCLKAAANIRQPIVNVVFIQGDSKSRKGARIRLEFGTLADSYRNRKKCLKNSIKSDTACAFSVTLSTYLLTCLLAGKTTAEEAWKGEGQQEIGDSLRNAVNKGQEIIDSILIQDASEPECELSITFRFGEAVNASIREDKKVLREIKRQNKQKKLG